MPEIMKAMREMYDVPDLHDPTLTAAERILAVFRHHDRLRDDARMQLIELWLIDQDSSRTSYLRKQRVQSLAGGLTLQNIDLLARSVNGAQLQTDNIALRHGSSGILEASTLAMPESVTGTVTINKPRPFQTLYGPRNFHLYNEKQGQQFIITPYGETREQLVTIIDITSQ